MNGAHPLPNPKEKEIFWEALELSSPEDIAAYLNQACVGDQSLRDSIENLLKNHRKNDLSEDTCNWVRHKKGDAINKYKVVNDVGEGGCAAVYRVEQNEPYYYQFALKLIKPEMASRQMLERFEKEWKALRDLKHSSIVKVSDVGTTSYGSPYFVMEMVDGKKITEYCDDQNLTLKKRLALFIKVCRAVQSAHESGIIHRDIKPSNILVIEESGEPLPKVIDFGIAKVTTSDQSTKNTRVTVTGQIIGTLAYMSPEQVQSNNQQIDERTDVYSLGVLLYEMLIGCLPLALDGLGQYEQFKKIVEEKPKQPSGRFIDLSEAEKLRIAQSRQTDPFSLDLAFQEDLDKIAMKCLEKKRDRRFETVSSLAASIEKVLKEWEKKELAESDESKEPPSLLTIVKTIIEPFWLADSLFYTEWERQDIAKSKWYKTSQGICGKLFLLLGPSQCVYDFWKIDILGGFVCLFIVITYTYIAFLKRKWRKPLKPLVAIPLETATATKLGWEIKVALAFFAVLIIPSFPLFIYLLHKNDNKLIIFVLFFSTWLIPGFILDKMSVSKNAPPLLKKYYSAIVIITSYILLYLAVGFIEGYFD